MRIIFFLTAFLFAQSKYPADSVLTSSQSSMFEKMAIFPIAGWQRLSHNMSILNCQFYPSCSQYGAICIQKNGLAGIPMTADRIVRCNPSAFYNHLDIRGGFHEPDGRLIDHPKSHLEISNKKSPVLAGVLSAVVPGSGRIYAGRWFDGMMGFFMVYITATTAYETSKLKNQYLLGVRYTMFGIFYFGEIYGAYRTAKYYQKTE